jgi:hypothetical protein
MESRSSDFRFWATRLDSRIRGCYDLRSHIETAFPEVPVERERRHHAQPVHGFKAGAIGQAEPLVRKPGHLPQCARQQIGIHEDHFKAPAAQQIIGDRDRSCGVASGPNESIAVGWVNAARSSAAPSALTSILSPYPGLTAGPGHWRPFGPDSWSISVGRKTAGKSPKTAPAALRA